MLLFVDRVESIMLNADIMTGPAAELNLDAELVCDTALERTRKKTVREWIVARQKTLTEPLYIY